MIIAHFFALTFILLSVSWTVCAATPVNEDDRWLVLKGQETNHPVIVSARQSLASATTRQRYINAVTLEWRYPVVGQGMPPDELLREMYSFEGEMGRELVKDGQALLAVTRTGNGLRRWIYYLIEKPSALTRLKRLADTRKGSVMVVSVAREPEWQSLSIVLAGVLAK